MGRINDTESMAFWHLGQERNILLKIAIFDRAGTPKTNCLKIKTPTATTRELDSHER